jgi:hypothetical protein
MTPPRFQFTIKGMLWATFWVAAGMAVVATPQVSRGIGLLVLFIAPLSALLSLFGRQSVMVPSIWIVWVSILLLLHAFGPTRY